jgi:hypothetical protein
LVRIGGIGKVNAFLALIIKYLKTNTMIVSLTFLRLVAGLLE